MLSAVGLAICVATAQAQALRDPTRPPIVAKSGGSGFERSGPAGWILQSVLISPERRYAIINGEIVAPGQSVGGAELVALAEGRATLRTPDGLQNVELFPDVARGGKGVEPATSKRRKDVPASTNKAIEQDSAQPGSQR